MKRNGIRTRNCFFPPSPSANPKSCALNSNNLPISAHTPPARASRIWREESGAITRSIRHWRRCFTFHVHANLASRASLPASGELMRLHKSARVWPSLGLSKRANLCLAARTFACKLSTLYSPILSFHLRSSRPAGQRRRWRWRFLALILFCAQQIHLAHDKIHQFHANAPAAGYKFLYQ